MDTVANSVCQLTEASAQAAYLVGIADPSSTAAAPGLIDQTQFARASQVYKGEWLSGFDILTCNLGCRSILF